ncbi:beta-N-acetylglucosaminidase domain-containing protein [Akkermansia sp. N21169]|uniref:beta-N-acetylglucosaminidase domain-containing protein n=1 Tax=Akkermansia sp. N21169 TaxID=3040765 RepID=UPI00244EADAC|nr:beta-N-acetylglucosaminidase domain-containing protein [Akkermansia sp. N21169]
MRVLHLPAFLMALSVSLPAMSVSGPDVYPTPQKAGFTGQFVKAAKVQIVHGKKTPNAPQLKDVPKIQGAYRLTVKPGLVTVAAHDDLGIFYAKQTLSQLLKGIEKGKYAQNDPFAGKELNDIAALGELAECDIIDWPDVLNRGTVEGFYGMYWSHEARKKQLEFYGRNKMNTYIYAPKDDQYHSHHWRQPYPAKEAAEIRELVETAKRNHVNFVWALHPGFSIKWTDEDRKNVLQKLEWMYDLGVRSFGLFFDDVGGEAARIDKQVELVSLVYKDFINKKGDVAPLIFCPSGYNRSWTNANNLSELGKMEPSAQIMWTGNSVVHDITTEGQEWVTGHLGRPVYIWWNFPVTDYCHDKLLMGRVYGLSQDDGIEKTMSGFVSNPMDRPEASKIGIFGIGNYAWNVKGYDSDKTWKDSIKRLYPQTHEAIQTFADHNSDIGPSGHGMRREESVDIAPAVAKLKEDLKSGNRQGMVQGAVYGEYEKIAKSADVLLNSKENPDLLHEIQPWVKAFRQLGIAGMGAINALQNDSINDLAKSVSALDEMGRIPDDYKQVADGKFLRKGLSTGALVMTPLARELVQMAADEQFTALTGRKPMHGIFSVSGGSDADSERMMDGKSETFWHSGSYQKPGDWYCLDFGQNVPVKNVLLTMGRNDKDSDFVAKGQLEASRDMKKWVPLGKETTGRQVFWQSTVPVQARALRYRVIEPNFVNPDKKGNTVWTAIREFAVNCPLPAMASSTVPGLSSLSVQETDKMIGINKVMEVHSMKKGDSITLALPEPVDATWMEVNLDNGNLPQWAEVSVETVSSASPVVLKLEPYQNKAFVTKGPGLPKGIKSLQLRNKVSQTQDIKLNMFKFDVPPRNMTHNKSAVMDGNLTTVYRADVPFDVTVENTDYPAATKVIIVGTATYKFQVQASNGSWSKTMGSVPNQAVTTFTGKGGIKAVRLISTNPQPGQSIHEVIFK